MHARSRTVLRCLCLRPQFAGAFENARYPQPLSGGQGAVCVCVCMWKGVCMCAFGWVGGWVCVIVCVCVCLCLCGWVNTRTHAHTRARAHTHVHMRAHPPTHIHMYVCMYVYIYIYIYIYIGVVPEAEHQRLQRFKRHVAAHGKELGTHSQKHFSIESLHRKYTRVLTFENLLEVQGCPENSGRLPARFVDGWDAEAKTARARTPR